ncbi:MAG: murein biosynthesis integral membrane protein MurJ [Bacillota bacterium]
MTSQKPSENLKRNVTAAAVIILLMNIVTKLLGFVREIVIARAFGATMYTDAYVVAYTLPYSVQQVIGNAIVFVTVPLLTKYIVDDNRGEANLAANSFLNSSALLMAAVALIGVAAAPLLVRITAPNLAASTALLAVRLTRLMFPTVIFFCLGMTLTGILNANRRFTIAAFAPAFSSIIIILFVLLTGDSLGIWGLAAGTLVSFIGFFLIQLPSSFAAGWRYRFRVSRHNDEIRAALVSLVPIILGMSVNQVYYILNRFFASGLAEGSISSLNYGARLAQLPSGIFVSAIAVAIYPLLSEYAIRGDLVRCREALERGVGVILLLAVPAAVGLMILRVPIVRLLFEHGAFTADDTLMTSSALLFYAGGIIAHSLVMLLLRVFFAFSDVKVPVIAGIGGIAVNIAVSLLTIGGMGHNGLALATTLASAANMLIFFLYVRKHLPDMAFRPLLISCGKIFFASAVMGIAVALTRALCSGWGDLALLCVAITVAVAVYLLLAAALRIREGAWLWEMVKNRFARSAKG